MMLLSVGRVGQRGVHAPAPHRRAPLIVTGAAQYESHGAVTHPGRAQAGSCGLEQAVHLGRTVRLVDKESRQRRAVPPTSSPSATSWRASSRRAATARPARSLSPTARASRSPAARASSRHGPGTTRQPTPDRRLPRPAHAPGRHCRPSRTQRAADGHGPRQWWRGPPARTTHPRCPGNQFRRRRVQLAVEVVTRLEPNSTPTRLAGDGQDESRGGSGGGRCSDGRSPGGRRGAAGALPRGRTASR